MKNIEITLFLMTLLVLQFSSCANDDIQETIIDDYGNGLRNNSISPISIDDIELGFWQDENHIQGISFLEDALIISNTKQLIKYDLKLGQVVEEKKCSDLEDEDCNSFHYGDISSYENDLWVAYSKAPIWNENIDCFNNQLLKYNSSVIDEESPSVVFPLDYPGHIGAVEIVQGKAYVSGKNIDSNWSPKNTCHEKLVIYVYNINELEEGQCNTHSESIIINKKGKYGVQVLSLYDSNTLLICPYRCYSNDSDYVYSYDLLTNKVSLFQELNWGYGVAKDTEGRIHFARNNSNSSVIIIDEFIE